MTKNRFRTHLFTLFFLIPFCSFGQDIIGQWKWTNKQMETDVYFSEEMYFMEAYLKGSKSQVSEGFSYYAIIGDTLIFNKIPLSEGREPLGYHLITSYAPDKMILTDLKNGNKNRYYRVNYGLPKLRKFRNQEFYYGGGSLFCVSDELNENYNQCLNFGEFSVNSSLEEIGQALGEPFDKMDHGGKLYQVYLLEQLENGTQPYVAIELEDGKLRSIQLTGESTIEDLSFSSISLGDYHTFVEQRLGIPSDTGPVDDETVYWDYAPFTFSLELKNGFVYSIKLKKQTP